MTLYNHRKTGHSVLHRAYQKNPSVRLAWIIDYVVPRTLGALVGGRGANVRRMQDARTDRFRNGGAGDWSVCR